MRTFPLPDRRISCEGAADVQDHGEGIQPWRLPLRYHDYADPGLLEAASMPSGVRVTFATDSPVVAIGIRTLPCGLSDRAARADLLVDGQRVASSVLESTGEQTLVYENLPSGTKTVSFYPSQIRPVIIRSVAVAPDASIEPIRDDLPRWITYGSSITHCGESDGPSMIWPAIVARSCGLHLTNLGFGSQGHMDPIVARTIAALPADCVTLKLAANTLETYTPRTWPAAAWGFVMTIRDAHPNIPLLIGSSIYFTEHETEPSKTGLSFSFMRDQDQRMVEIMRRRGDRNVHYLDGRELFSEADRHLLIDGVHPGPEGVCRMAERFEEKVFGREGLRLMPG